MNFCLVEVHDLADLFQVIASVILDVFFGQFFRPGSVAAAGVADKRRRVADNDDRLMAELLKLANLSQRYGVAKVDIDAGRINSILNTEWRAGFQTLLQLPSQLFFRNDFFDAAADNRELFFNRWELHGGIVNRVRELELDRARRLPTRREAFQRWKTECCFSRRFVDGRLFIDSSVKSAMAKDRANTCSW